ncbi:MAG: hypothetical protein ACLUFN_05825 [Eubacterium sp.]
MKTSKKLLSLFLALVMIITSCSVGFTAFAADGNKTDTNSDYWSDGTDAEAAFASLNDLVDTYIPQLLQIDAIKKLLEENLGMKVTDTTTISDVVAGASPLLLGLLGGSNADKASIRGDSSPIADIYYSYLDDENAVMDFYSLYAFCRDNRSSGSSELQAYCRDTYEKLNNLLNAYSNAELESNNALSEANDVVLGKYLQCVAEQYKTDDFSKLTLEDFRNVNVDGTLLSDIKDPTAETFVKFIKGWLDGAQTGIAVDNLADAMYYYIADQANMINSIFKGLAEMGGATVPENTVLQDTFDNEFYYEMTLAVLIYSNLFNADDIKSMEVTDKQLEEFASYASSRSTFYYADFINYLNSGDCVFSIPAAEYIEQAAIKSESRKDGIMAQFLNAAIANDVDALKSFAYTMGTAKFENQNMNFIDQINYMIPSELIKIYISPSYATNETTDSVSAISVYLLLSQYYSLVAPLTASVAYKYADYAIPSDLVVEAVNSSLNSTIASILDKDSDIGKMVAPLINDLFESDIKLYDSDGSGVLNDLWLNLYKAPVETIFNLLPTLTIALDELILPIVLNGEGDLQNKSGGPVFSLLCGETGILHQYTQEVGSDIGIGALTFDLNKVVPSILHWLVGDEETAYNIVGHYTGDVYDNNIPVFTNIFVADKALYGARIGTGSVEVSGLARTIFRALSKSTDKAEDIKTNKQIAIGVDEIVTEIATFAMNAVDTYLAEHANDARYDADGDAITQRGLNNIFVALPQVLDQMGKDFIKKYNVDSDWTYTYDGKITTITKTKNDKTVTQLQNNTLDAFKKTATLNDAEEVLNQFVNIFIGNWINGLLDFVNDTFADENNDITSKIPLVQGLLAALGGLGETSIITDVVNGLFQLKRSDDASFTLTKRSETGFVGFSNESGFFLLSNIQFNKNGENRGLVPVIMTLVKNDGASNDYKVGNALKASTPLLTASKKSAAGTDYSKLLSGTNTAAAEKLIDTLDELLSSLLSNTSLNGFDWDSTDNILSSLVTFASGYFGAENTNAIVKLLNNYLYFVVGENKATTSKNGKIGTAPTADGNVDKKKVYTSANLSNLVIQTYSLVENIVDYLFYNKDSGLLTKRDPNMLIADALYGIISPDAVAVRLSKDYADTADILKDKDNLNWNSFKVQITEANNTKGTWSKDYLKFGFKNGDKTAFYDALGESLNGIAAIVGVVLTNTYTDSSRTNNWYSEIVYPVLNSMAKATGASGVMSPSAFNKATDSQKLIKGILTPVSSIMDQIYDAPVTFVLNIVKGLAGVLQDSYVKKIVNGAIDSINNIINGAVGIVNYLSPTLAAMINDLIGGGIRISLPKKDIVITLINDLLGELFTLPNIDWSKLASAKSPAEVLLLVYGYLVDTVLGSELIQNLIDSLAPGLSDILKKLSATQILDVINKVLAVVQSPTEVYWTFSEYASKLAGTFSYPKGLTASDANKAVDQLDELVANVFPLLNGLGVTDIKGLASLVNDNLYTNDILTKALAGIYGLFDTVIDKNSGMTIADILKAIGIDVSPKGIAAYLTNSEYGTTYSSAASTLKKAKSWKSVKKINWGFKDGSSKAQTGFVNGLAAIFRPFNDILAIFLAEGKLDLGGIDINSVIKTLNISGKSELGDGEYGCTLKYSLKKGIFKLTIQSNVKTAEYHDYKDHPSNKNVVNVFEIDLVKIINEFQNSTFNGVELGIGTNGYENAIIPILEAFMCDDVKTYKQYKADYKKAKDNLLINVLKPIVGLVDDVCDAPFDTITKILPNVAYFLDSNGLAQAVSNLLAPVTAENGLIGILDKNGLNVDDLVEIIAGKSLGKIVKDALGLKVNLNLELTHLEKCNIQDIVVPLVNSILKKNKINIKVPDIDFAQIASHGTIQTVKSKAKNDKGKYTTKQVKANQGEVLVAALRYISDVLIKNASGLKKLLCGIDAIKKNATIANIIKAVFNQIGTASKDDIVLAVFYLLTEEATNKFFDYRDFKYDDSYEFTFGNMDEDFCRQLAPMLDGLVGGLIEGGLSSLVEKNLYTDNIVSSLATGLYSAIEGVKISDDIGSLTHLLAMTDIDFSTSNVAALLTNKDYGTEYPDAASVIKSAGSWSKVNKDSLKWGVTDRNSFMNALVAVLRPIYGVLDVLLNDASLNLFDLIKLPGSDGYTSTIVPLLEAFGVYNIKTQYQYREDIYEAYDNILLDIINPLWDKVEDILNAPIETLADILPNLSLFFANNGLLQIVENLLTPVSALLEALKPIVDINEILIAAGLDVPKLLKEKVGINISKFDLYDLSGTLAPLVGADNVVGFLNSILGIIKIKGQPLGIVLPEIDWFQLASHGEFVLDGTSQAATYGSRIYVVSDQDETLIAVLRYLINTINYKGNYDAIVGLIGGLLGDGGNDSMSGTISQVLDMVKGDADTVIESLVDMLQQFAG